MKPKMLQAKGYPYSYYICRGNGRVGRGRSMELAYHSWLGYSSLDYPYIRINKTTREDNIFTGVSLIFVTVSLIVLFNLDFFLGLQWFL